MLGAALPACAALRRGLRGRARIALAVRPGAALFRRSASRAHGSRVAAEHVGFSIAVSRRLVFQQRTRPGSRSRGGIAGRAHHGGRTAQSHARNHAGHSKPLSADTGPVLSLRDRGQAALPDRVGAKLGSCGAIRSGASRLDRSQRRSRGDDRRYRRPAQRGIDSIGSEDSAESGRVERSDGCARRDHPPSGGRHAHRAVESARRARRGREPSRRVEGGAGRRDRDSLGRASGGAAVLARHGNPSDRSDAAHRRGPPHGCDQSPRRAQRTREIFRRGSRFTAADRPAISGYRHRTGIHLRREAKLFHPGVLGRHSDVRSKSRPDC